jgi:16S rRNA G527 N7-methylase RsmG
VTLIEARERRHHFQRHAIRELGLDNAVALRGRAELLPASPHACAIAQAAARQALALGWLARWVAPGGYAVIPGSETPPDASDALPAGWSARIVPYRVPLGGRRRTAWIGQAP